LYALQNAGYDVDIIREYSYKLGHRSM